MSEIERHAADVLGVAGVRTTSTSLEFLDPATTIEEWGSVGEKASALLDVGKWWLGDWLVYGDDRYGERYPQAASLTNRSVRGLRNMAWVARNVRRDVRRELLSFSHHEVVAAMPRAEQVRWLDYAEENELTVMAFRAHIHAAKERASEKQRITTSGRPGAPKRSPRQGQESEPLPLPDVPPPNPCESAWDAVLAAVAAATKTRVEGGDWTSALRRLRVVVENAVECDQLVVVESKPSPSRGPEWA